jgi:AcrR family transcriptional regulator
MNEHSIRRPYRMSARAEAAARTGRGILDAAVALWRERSLDDVTLEDIAAAAGVSARTVLRRFGSRDGVIEACIAADAAGVVAERDRVPAGDVDGALGTLLAHYERDGDAVLRTLALEDRLPAARSIAETGRAAHRAWCDRVFAPRLPPPGAAGREARLDACVAATDLALWKLLRRDLDRSPEWTRTVMRTLLDGVLGPSPQPS